MRHLQYVLFAVLCSFLFVYGLYPAWNGIGTDFPNYYTASRLLAQHSDLSRIYDDGWFQEQIYANGINQQGKFAPFPPITAFLMLPVASFSPLVALRVWSAVNLLLLAGLVLVLMQLTGKPWVWVANMVLLSGLALSNNFKFGQAYLLLLFLILLGFKYRLKDNNSLSGLSLGIGAALKYFPVIYLVQFVMEKRWKLCLALIGSIFALNIMGLAVLGPGVYSTFFSSVLGGHLAGMLQNPFSSTFQSFNSLFRRLFIADPLLNPAPFLDSPAAFGIALFIVYCAVIGLTANIWSKLSKAVPQADLRPDLPEARLKFSILTLAGLVLLPASGTYHFLLLILPVVTILTSLKSPNMMLKAVFLFLYAVAGFIPYHFFRTFELEGMLAVLAYPRLWVMVGIYVVAILLIRASLLQQGRTPTLAVQEAGNI